MCPWENAPPKSSEVKAKTKSLSGIFFTLSLIGNGEALGLTRLGSGLGVRFRKVADSLHIPDAVLHAWDHLTSQYLRSGQARFLATLSSSCSCGSSLELRNEDERRDLCRSRTRTSLALGRPLRIASVFPKRSKSCQDTLGTEARVSGWRQKNCVIQLLVVNADFWHKGYVFVSLIYFKFWRI